MRTVIAVTVLVCASVTVESQPAPRLCWDHDGLNLSRFEIVVDSGTPASVGIPSPTGITYCTAVPDLTAGTHTLSVRSCLDNGTPETTTDDVCATSPSITVVKL